MFVAGLSLSITPGKLGELVKSYLLRELHGMPATQTAPIVVAERVTDLIALLVLAVVGVAVVRRRDRRSWSSPGGVVAFGLVLLAWPRPTRALIDLVTRPRCLRRFREPLHEIYGGLAALCRPSCSSSRPRSRPGVGLRVHRLRADRQRVPRRPRRLGLAMLIYAATTIAGALSFLPGGLGVTEGAMTILLVAERRRLDRATALAATLLTRLATLWFAVALGLVCLALPRAASQARDRAAEAANLSRYTAGMSVGVDFDFARWLAARRGSVEQQAREGAAYAFSGERKFRRTLGSARPVTMALEATTRLWRDVARNELLGTAVKVTDQQYPRVWRGREDRRRGAARARARRSSRRRASSSRSRRSAPRTRRT